jgi:hypothetical protein
MCNVEQGVEFGTPSFEGFLAAGIVLVEFDLGLEEVHESRAGRSLLRTRGEGFREGVQILDSLYNRVTDLVLLLAWKPDRCAEVRSRSLPMLLPEEGTEGVRFRESRRPVDRPLRQFAKMETNGREAR